MTGASDTVSSSPVHPEPDERKEPIMKITHPFHGRIKGTTLTPEIIAYVARLKDLPTIQLEKPYLKAYWEPTLGMVPAGTYSDPDAAATERAVEGLYHALKGAKITRHRVAVALNLVSADQVDDIRDRLEARGALITRGAPGVSVNSTKHVADVIAGQAAKQAAKAS